MTVEELVVSLGLEVDGSALGKAHQFFAALTSGAAGVFSAFAAVGAGMVAAAGYTAKAADHVDELSQSLGVSADMLQRVGYAAGFSSLSMEQVGRSIKFLAKNGSKDALGDILKLADTFEKMPDGTAKTALAIKKLGKTGAEMIPMLNEGRAKLEELFAEAPVMSPETIKSGVELSDAITRIQGALKKMVFMIGAPLLKPLGAVATILIKWFNANEKLIGKGVNRFVEEFSSVVKGAVEIVGTAVRGIYMLGELLGGWPRILAGATAAFAAFAVATNAPAAGIVGLLLVLNSFKRYMEGRDSVVGDGIEAFKKAWSDGFNVDYKSSGIYLFFAWLMNSIRDASIELSRLTGRYKDGVGPMTSGERDDHRAFNERIMANMANAGISVTQGKTDVSNGQWVPVNQDGSRGPTTNNVTVQVNGAGDPKVVGQAVYDKIQEQIDAAHGAY